MTVSSLRIRWLAVLTVLAIAVVLSACSNSPASAPTPQPTPTPTATLMPTATPMPQPTPIPTTTPVPTATPTPQPTPIPTTTPVPTATPLPQPTVPPDDDPLRLREGEQAWGMSLMASGPEFVPLRTFRDDDLLDPGSDPLIALLGVLENGVYTPRGKAEPELSLSEVAGMAHQVGGRLPEMEYGLGRKLILLSPRAYL